MANIKREKRDGSLLVGYRPFPGQPERYGTCPSRKEFEAFVVVERQHHREGVEVPNPSELYRPEPIASEPARRDMTLTQWIGTPSKGTPGDFFDHAREMGTDRPTVYERSIASHIAPHLLDEAGQPLTMRRTKRKHISAMVARWLVCPNCEARADAQGVKLTVHQLSVRRAPFDGRCVTEDFDGEEVSAHYPRFRRATLQRHLAFVAAAFNAGQHCDDPVCDANPAKGYQIPQFEEPPSNEDQTQALDHLQLLKLSEAHPPTLQAAPQVKAYGLLRRAELFGTNRGDITWPGPDDEGVGHLEICRVFVLDRSTGRFALRPWGKTPSATLPVELAAPATAALRRHMELYRSTPNPQRCRACAEGTGEWTGRARNPHRHCDFADDAPVFVGVDGQRQDPANYSSVVFPAAVAAVPELAKAVVGFRVTPKVLRATGGTLLLELGVPDDVVMKMGRWTNIATLKRHYFKMRDSARHSAAKKLGDAAAADLGYAVAEDMPIDMRLRAIEHRALRAEAELERLQALVVELGGDPTPPAPLIKMPKDPRGVWVEEKLRQALDGAPNQGEVLRRLGVTLSGKHYRKLETAAARFALDLPPRWAQVEDPRGVWAEEKLRRAVAGAATQTEILRRLGLSKGATNYRKLEAAAARAGLELPARQGAA